MIKSIKRKHVLNILGIAVIAFWIIMMGLMVKRENLEYLSEGVNNGIAKPLIDSKEREWKEIFLNGKKVGYSINIIQPFGDGYYIQEEIFLRLNLMGLERGLYTITQSGVDEDFILKSFNFKMNSGVISYNISGRVEGNQLVVMTGEGRRRRRQSIQLSEPPTIGAGMAYMFKTLRIHVGDSYRIPFFDPSTMSQNEAVFKVVAQEPLKIKDITYSAFRVETEMWGNRLSFWLDEEGNVLKEEGFMGLVMIKSSAANAPLGIEGDEDTDFYEMTAVPADRKLPDVERLSYLKLDLDGVEDLDIARDAWAGGRQGLSDGDIIEVWLEEIPLMGSYSIPYDQHDPELTPFLVSEFNIESDVDEIRQKARDILAEEKDPVNASRRLLNWVYHNLDKRPVVNVPSALEVLETRMGDCNEHAVLLTALLRASGIPARLNIGLVYNQGRFFYHAWNEAYLGKWISMDATLNQMPADVSHIRLVIGNLDKQVEIMGLIGKLNIQVLDFEYDRTNSSYQGF
jgi:hypothetical protein